MQRTILDKFTQEVVKQTQKIKIGDPLLEGTRMGPLINRPHLERVLGFVKSAKEQVTGRGPAGGGQVPLSGSCAELWGFLSSAAGAGAGCWLPLLLCSVHFSLGSARG